MNIAICLTHNKNAAQNRNQITALNSLLTKVTETRTTTRIDENGDPVEEVILDEETSQPVQFFSHYTISNVVLTEPYKIFIYQIIPFGVTPPSNRDILISYNVIYGKGDEDKTGTHPRFFNWMLKRATDHGADIILDLFDISLLSPTDSAIKLNIFKADDLMIYQESTSSRYLHLKLLRNIGQLDERLTLSQAIVNLKERITAKGYRYAI